MLVNAIFDLFKRVSPEDKKEDVLKKLETLKDCKESDFQLTQMVITFLYMQFTQEIILQ